MVKVGTPARLRFFFFNDYIRDLYIKSDSTLSGTTKHLTKCSFKLTGKYIFLNNDIVKCKSDLRALVQLTFIIK